MVLVDTSIWIEYLGREPGPGAARLDVVIRSGEPFAITSVILQEILQGARSPKEFARLRKYLSSQRFLYPEDLQESYVRAAAIYSRCRQSGVTPRGSVDCLIAQVAIEHEARLLHQDEDFTNMARVVKELSIC